MNQTRRDALLLALAGPSALSLAIPAKASGRSHATRSRAKDGRWRAGVEGQRGADLGNGMYRNPVLAGDRPDPHVLRDGDDYYAAFSSFDYYPAVVLWHSRDLVNWTPLAPALAKRLGSVYALDIAKHNGRYFIYIPTVTLPGDPAPDGQEPIERPVLKVFAIHADSIRGPWSEPVDLGIRNLFDPGHAVGEDGRRYLFLSFGYRVALSDDGLSTIGKPEPVYKGWPIPEEWEIEAFGLEGPKVLRYGGWFYLFSAQGGTAGPPTSHMVIVARSRSIHGPWENSPYNPIVRTASADEPWWSRGHATPVQGPNGDWWLSYHGYENGYRTLGRQMLLDRMSWTADGWPVASGGDLSHPLPMPTRLQRQKHGLSLSGDFLPDMLGSKFAFYKPRAGYLSRARFQNGALTLHGQGDGPGDSSPLAFIAGDLAYQVDVDIDVDVRNTGQGGLLLFYGEKLFAGVGLSRAGSHTYSLGAESIWNGPVPVGPGYQRLRVINRRQVASFYRSENGGPWTKIISVDVAGYNHNMGQGFVSLRPALFASGNGSATFRNLRYAAIHL